MRFLSLFSGIEAASIAWKPLGWECVGVSEIEPFPCAVLAHHYPDVPNLGDVTKITEDDIKKLGQIDLVVFGFPCQDLSVAGGRKGFQGERSSLFYDAIRVIEYAKRHCGTRFALLENVPGAFSSNKGADFTEVVKHMAGLDELDTPKNGWGKEGAALGDNGLLEWSVLDAQWFGLAQRRKRVFAIVDFGDWASRPPILLERHSLRGNTPPSREARESVTADATRSFNESGFAGYSRDSIAGTLRQAGGACGHGSECLTVARLSSGNDVTGTLSACNGDKQFLGNQEAFSGDFHVIESVAIAGNIIGRTEGNGGNGNGFDDSGACYTLTTNDRHAVCIGGQHPNASVNADGSCPTLTSAMGMGGGHVPIAAYGFKAGQGAKAGGIGYQSELSPTLTSANSGSNMVPSLLIPPSVVRRLTPIECEKLQGFPVDFTKIPYRNKSADECPNGVRYKALGNSMAVNVMAYIGQRVQATQGVKAYT